MITNAEDVTNHFGYWPVFCDGKLEAFLYELPGVIELSIFYIDAELKRSAHIGLRFVGVTEMELNQLRQENWIDEIQIEEGLQSVVTIRAAYGLCGKFSCSTIAVTYVRI